jgi:hypothetical protein
MPDYRGPCTDAGRCVRADGCPLVPACLDAAGGRGAEAVARMLADHRAEADAWRRAYLGHGDQLGALEAEAARDEMQALASRPLSAGEWLRGLARLFGPWTDDPPRPRRGHQRIRPP